LVLFFSGGDGQPAGGDGQPAGGDGGGDDNEGGATRRRKSPRLASPKPLLSLSAHTDDTGK